jgi:clan AA aspartic protease
MIVGSVNIALEARVKITIRGGSDAETEIEAILDTGFTGFLTLPSATITQMQLEWLGREEGILGDGSVALFDVYVATILWDSKLKKIEVNASQTDPLVGMGLIRGHFLQIHAVLGGQVIISRLEPQSPESNG